MLLIKLLLLVVGCIITVFGILIAFCKKYSFINYYEKKKDLVGFKQNAKTIGLVEFIVGVICIVYSICALIFIPDNISVCVYIVLIIGFITSLVINELVFYKKNKAKQ